MIVDTLDNWTRYADLSADLAIGLEFLTTAAAGLADGRYPLDGERIFATVSSYRTREEAAVPFEAHRLFADIQCLLVGREVMYWMPRGRAAVRQPYMKDKDREHLEDGESSAVILTPGIFAVLSPQDAHKPGCVTVDPEDVRKVVVKVPVW